MASREILLNHIVHTEQNRGKKLVQQALSYRKTWSNENKAVYLNTERTTGMRILWALE